MLSFYIFLIKRYIGGRGRQVFSMNAWLSFIGVFVGSSLLVIVLSVFNGFQQQIRASIFRFDPHIIIESRKSPGKIDDWQKWIKTIKDNNPGAIESGTGMIQSPALIRKNEQIDQVMIRGMEFPVAADKARGFAFPAEFPQITEPEKLQYLPIGDFCFVGRELGLLLDLNVGDTIQLIVPKGQFTTRVGVEPGMRTYKISGFFSSGNYQYDSRVVIISLPTAQALFAAGDSVQQIAVKLTNFSFLKKVMLKIYDDLPYNFSIRSIEDENRNLFAALKWEKVIMTIIVFLFIIAALVGVIVSTSNVIRTKRRDIGVLKSLGASDQDILTVFTLLGFISGLAGTILGVSFGIFTALHLEDIIGSIESIINGAGSLYCRYSGSCLWIRMELMPKDVYYFDHMPVSIDVAMLQPLSITAVFLAGLAALIPAWTAGKLQPMDIIRSSDT